jgi:hypothetical protein
VTARAPHAADTKVCPRCGEDIRESAIVCRFCGFDYASLGRRSTNGFAIASLVLGVLWLASIGSILAVIFGVVARRQNKRTGEAGDGLALAGIILGVVGIAALLAVIVVALLDTAPKDVTPIGLGTQTPAPANRAPVVPAATRSVRLLVKASRGSCWLQVHETSATGRILFQGTLDQGQQQLFTAKKLWITLDRPANLVTVLNGRTRLLPVGGVKTLIVTARGIRPAV